MLQKLLRNASVRPWCLYVMYTKIILKILSPTTKLKERSSPGENFSEQYLAVLSGLRITINSYSNKPYIANGIPRS